MIFISSPDFGAPGAGWRPVMSLIAIGTVEVDVARPDETALAAAQRLLQRNVGSLVVVDAERRPVGLLTDRDLVTRVMAEGRDPAGVAVQEVMSRPVATIGQDAGPDTALAVLRRERCRRLPIVDGEGRLRGIVTLDDLLRQVAAMGAAVTQILGQESPAALARVQES
jgi:CBS-domain-containing membrane protein